MEMKIIFFLKKKYLSNFKKADSGLVTINEKIYIRFIIGFDKPYKVSYQIMDSRNPYQT